MNLITFTLIVNFIWHLLASELFTFKAKYTMENYIRQDLNADIGPDIIRFVGGLNWGYMVFAFLTIFTKELHHPAVFLLFAIANFSQFVFDIKAHRENKVTSKFKKITVGDGVIALLNLFVSALLLFR